MEHALTALALLDDDADVRGAAADALGASQEGVEEEGVVDLDEVSLYF